jgi:hypothetical protein
LGTSDVIVYKEISISFSCDCPIKIQKIIIVPVLCNFVSSHVESAQFVDVLERRAVEKISTYEGESDKKLTELHRGRILIF